MAALIADDMNNLHISTLVFIAPIQNFDEFSVVLKLLLQILENLSQVLETPSLTYSCVSPHIGHVSRRWLKHRLVPLWHSPGCWNRSNLKRLCDTKSVGLGFAIAEPSPEVLSYPLFDMALCFLLERKKWLQENQNKFMIFNKRRRWFHSSRVKLPLVNMSATWFLVSTYVIWIIVHTTNQAQLCAFLTRVSLLDFCP